jgi:hypothetical protein
MACGGPVCDGPTWGMLEALKTNPTMDRSQALRYFMFKPAANDYHFTTRRHLISVTDTVVIKLSQHGAPPPALLPDSLFCWA